ncbi:sigma-70 family RNA polymerase sigma factor [Lentzea sp. PSKA42]|uniref:Sigma-70 family RNA polymerase sigma factor n=1 Tax=Lentzea indica TaxID=2604800 RepID=A0ABX1FEK9_9PSEU|nr:sigma-70 family RNA polymerase sigma factor [Lentzea indica]NKE57383.1 sigma-70 family RNA polymerase sigma factor [Lentzea indica]
MNAQPGTATVVAAQAGDQRALDELVAGYLPLVYNIVGRALAGHSDIDDVVQETMLRVVHGLGALRDPGSFRSWLVAITMRQVRDRGRLVARADDRELAEVADPGADFVDLTLLRLELSGQRREVAEATRWVDSDDRELLSLWWLEASGELSRAELAAAMGITTQHAAVRVQRSKATLAAGRAVVRVLRMEPRCPELVVVVRNWDGVPTALWRKRIAQHTRVCGRCEVVWQEQVPAERLLAGLALVPVPVALLPQVLGGSGGSGAVRWWKGLFSKPVAAAVATVVAVTAGTVVYTSTPDASPQPAAQTGEITPTTTTSTTTTTVAPSSTDTATTTATTTPKTTPAAPAGPRYGSVVDTVDSAPDKLTPPKKLPVRPAGEITAAGGQYADPQRGWIGGRYVMMRRGEHVVLRGRGYFMVRYEIAWFNRPGGMVMPTWTGLRGKLFHVASGGTKRMDDQSPGKPAGYSPMGEPVPGPSGPAAGYVHLPAGAQQMWQNEFFYLDGEVALYNNERGADYNITATPKTWDEVTADITAPPAGVTGGKGGIRYGLVRDTGDDGAPVPQYVTREKPADPATVPQQSAVS